MTMLSLTYNQGFPIILSDILLTSDEGEKNFSLPTHLDGAKRLIDNNFVTGSPVDLKQKVYIINDCLCVVLGGRLDQMYSFLNYMQTFFENKIPNAKELDEHLKNYDKDKRDKLLALVILATVNGNQVEFEIKTVGNWKKENHNVFDFIFSGGSGSNDFLVTARDYTGGYGHTNEFNKALTQNLDLLSKFLGFEVTSEESILNRWGAGFELTYFFFTKFKKLKEYTYILFSGTYEDTAGLLCQPYAVMKYKYYNDTLIIRAANAEREELFQVNPINENHDKLTFKESNLPDFQSKDLILGYIIKLPNGQIYLPSFVILADKQEMVRLKVDNGHLEITTKEALTKHIENEIKKL
jgi:hypothetical protein